MFTRKSILNTGGAARRGVFMKPKHMKIRQKLSRSSRSGE